MYYYKVCKYSKYNKKVVAHNSSHLVYNILYVVFHKRLYLQYIVLYYIVELQYIVLFMLTSRLHYSDLRELTFVFEIVNM